MKPTENEAKEAVRTLLKYAGEDPDREGLRDTPARVVRAYSEWFSGYTKNPREILERTFSEIEGYDDMIILKDIRFESHCEHHMVPIIGAVHIGYLPRDRVVGISKLARIVDAFAKRFQIQEVMTSQIANTISEVLNPRGVAVIVEGKHLCISTRGIHKTTAKMATSSMLGLFRDNAEARNEFMKLIADK